MKLHKWGDLPVNLFTGLLTESARKAIYFRRIAFINFDIECTGTTIGATPPHIALKFGHIKVGGIPSLLMQ